ncbi:MAG: hypothetical protein H0X64_04225, partial [Gemmatimonadaceae bacterium]|nr:hypothetical protein [Gemmatimonadaceae bacterium]
RNILRDALSRRRSEGVIDGTKDFLLDRLDDALEPLARSLSGKAVWSEMKENARRAALSAEERKRFTDPSAATVDGASHLAAHAIAALCARDQDVAVHIAAHSAGSIFMAPFIGTLRSAFAEAGVARGPIATCSLWAPACTVSTFEEDYRPFLDTGAIDELALYTLTDEVEQDDHCARIYNKSLLYLVSNAFESKPRIPLFREGEPILGMARHAGRSDAFTGASPKVAWIQAPNNAPAGDPFASHAKSHGAFDDDEATVAGTLRRVTAWGRGGVLAGLKARGGTADVAAVAPGAAVPAPMFERSARSSRERRIELNRES